MWPLIPAFLWWLCLQMWTLVCFCVENSPCKATSVVTTWRSKALNDANWPYPVSQKRLHEFTPKLWDELVRCAHGRTKASKVPKPKLLGRLSAKLTQRGEQSLICLGILRDCKGKLLDLPLMMAWSPGLLCKSLGWKKVEVLSLPYIYYECGSLTMFVRAENIHFLCISARTCDGGLLGWGAQRGTPNKLC